MPGIGGRVPLIAANLIGEVRLHTMALELDFVNPSRPDGPLSTADAKSGSTKPRKGALMPIRAGF
jgi:hypothetical protein